MAAVLVRACMDTGAPVFSIGAGAAAKGLGDNLVVLFGSSRGVAKISIQNGFDPKQGKEYDSGSDNQGRPRTRDRAAFVAVAAAAAVAAAVATPAATRASFVAWSREIKIANAFCSSS